MYGRNRFSIIDSVKEETGFPLEISMGQTGFLQELSEGKRTFCWKYLWENQVFHYRDICGKNRLSVREISLAETGFPLEISVGKTGFL